MVYLFTSLHVYTNTDILVYKKEAKEEKEIARVEALLEKGDRSRAAEVAVRILREVQPELLKES